MGLDINGLRALAYAKSQLHANFDRITTLGRQEVHMSAKVLNSVLNDFKIPVTSASASDAINGSGGYAEKLLQLLGGKDVSSFDASDYEDATHVHDFNLPLPMQYQERFSTVVDLGTLEHVFNFPQAIKNCMEMVEVGGSFISITPANNLFGHGFYQFSPELYYRVLSKQNGFEVQKIFSFENLESPHWKEIIEPNMAKYHATLISSRPVYLAVFAKRVAKVPIFATYPQQGDYQDSMWEKKENTNLSAKPTLKSKLKALIPKSSKGIYYSLRATLKPYDQRIFKSSRMP